MKLIKELCSCCPNISDLIIVSTTKYCLRANNEVKCIEARDLLMTLAESKQEQYVKLFQQSKKIRSLLADCMTKCLDIKYKKRERAIFTVVWAAKFLKAVLIREIRGQKESKDLFLGVVRPLVPFLRDHSAKVVRGAEQSIYFILQLYREGKQADNPHLQQSYMDFI